MARINKFSITLCALLFTSLSFSHVAHASGQTRHTATHKTHLTKTTERKKKTARKSDSRKTAASKKTHTAVKTAKTRSSRRASVKTASAVSARCTTRKGYKSRCDRPIKTAKLSDLHKARMQKAKTTAMNKLMDQIGKPYHWGGTSPRTGFDCSGLVYYAYKDLVKFHIPRTANEMYHLRDAAPVNRSELQSGDLVFFRTRGRGTADHVGVYLGNGKFIQSPRSGQDIQITSLSEDYWVRHYVGARRVMTPTTIR